MLKLLLDVLWRSLFSWTMSYEIFFLEKNSGARLLLLLFAASPALAFRAEVSMRGIFKEFK